MVREEGIGPSAFAYQTKILTVILLPHNISYMEPEMGLEPIASRLQGERTAIVLSRHIEGGF